MLATILAPAAAFAYHRPAPSPRWFDALLPPLGIPPNLSCGGIPDGGTGFRAYFIFGMVGRALFNHHACALLLLLGLLFVTWPLGKSSRARRRLTTIALASALVSIATLFTIMVCVMIVLFATPF
ncbi:MAG: hypothetical protein QM756_02765 [Polyangiaceae bacterium]